MKNIFNIAFAAFIICQVMTLSASAQSNKGSNSSGLYLSVGPDASIPVGHMHDRYDWGIGGSVQIDVPIVQNTLNFVGSAGFNNFFSTINTVNGSDLQMIPLKAGLKYTFLQNLYVQGTAGTSFLLDKTKGGYDKSAVFSYAPQIGYQIPVGANYIDAGIRWEGNTKFHSNSRSNNFLGLRVAYAFGL